MIEKNKHDLNQVYSFINNGISSVVAVSNELLGFNKDSTIDDVINLLTEKLKFLGYFDSFAFYEVKDLIDFEQTHCYPGNASALIEQDVEKYIDNGTFAWVLNSSRPTTFEAPVSGRNQVLVSLASKRRIHGMFIANAKDGSEISGVILDMLQLILSVAVFSIDNLELTEQLTEYTHNLESKVSERTKELENAVLRAEQSTKARTEFLANMSHEIRTPMNGVLGMMDLLKETPLDKKQLHYVTTAKNSGNNMLVILNDILDLSKVESGKMVVEEEEFNLIETIDDLVSLFAQELQDKGVDLLVSIDPIIPVYLLGGQTRFWQIVMNLLGNAKKFTESGEIYLSLTLNDIDNENVDIIVSVKDTGIGISEKSLGKIFESFEQAEVNTSRHYGGTGLGLALCQNLVKMMGGDIEVKSTLGEGSEFIFNVKMKRVIDAPETFSFEKNNNFNALYFTTNDKVFDFVISVFKSLQVKHTLCGSEEDVNKMLLKMKSGNTNMLFFDEDTLIEKGWGIEEVKSKFGNSDIEIAVVCNEGNKDSYSDVAVITKPFQINKLYRYLQMLAGETDSIQLVEKENTKLSADVLVVEDNEVNQLVARGMLENMGCSVTIAANGQIGLDTLSEKTFDIVFMDINMPVLDGYEATRKYREIEPDDEHLPIIALTANVLTEDVTKYYEAGVDDYIAKPFSADKLREVLVKWVPQETVEISSEQVNDSETSNIDVEKIDSLKEMMGDAFSSLVTTFIRTSSALKNDIIDNKGDHEKLTRDVHTLKGSSGTMGAKKIFLICEEFESLLRKGDDSGRAGAIEKISNELKAFHKYLLS